jgi:hypothetical protein
MRLLGELSVSFHVFTDCERTRYTACGIRTETVTLFAVNLRQALAPQTVS